MTPQTRLHCEPCYDGFECPRLILPLDYKDSTNPHHISLAVIRLPATVAEDDPKHGGSIILNPGGPGSSGVWWSLSVAKRLQEGLSVPGGKQFEIMSFDPRGMMYSKPNMYCFATPFDAQLWEHEKLAKKALWTPGRKHCTGSGISSWPEDASPRQAMSTSGTTVRTSDDMLELVKAIDTRKANMMDKRPDSAQAALHREEDSVPKIQYYGQSYGTFLGQLSASMYPENFGRIILDANIDGDKWTSDHE